jgi:hypothetical protein
MGGGMYDEDGCDLSNDTDGDAWNWEYSYDYSMEPIQ